MLTLQTLTANLDKKEFWSNSCKELSDKLFLPSENKLNKGKNYLSIKNDHWYESIISKDNINNLNINLSTDLIKEIKDLNNNLQPKVVKVTEQLRIYPQSVRYYKQAFALYRFSYNKAVELYNNNKAKLTEEEILKEKERVLKYRNNKLIKKYGKDTKLLKLEDIKVSIYRDLRPEIKALAIKEFKENNKYYHNDVVCQAVDEAKNNFINSLKKIKGTKLNKPFKLKFKSVKEPIQTLTVARLRKMGPSTLLKIKNFEDIPEYALNKHCKVTRHNGQYMLAMTKEAVVHPLGFLTRGDSCEIQALQPNFVKVCSIDPGIRTFATVYSENIIHKIGNKFVNKLKPLLIKMDILQRKIAKLKNKYNKINIMPQWCSDKIRYFEKRIERLQRRKQNLVKDLHYKTADLLVKNYDIILLPTFPSQKMVKKPEPGNNNTKAWQRYIRKVTNRSMMNLSHYKFKQILKWMCLKYGKLVLECSEAYTSKTRWDGYIDTQLGSNTTISNDYIKVDRDVNGARNIFIKTVLELSGSSISGRLGPDRIVLS